MLDFVQPEKLDAMIDCLTDGPPPHALANVVMVALITGLTAATAGPLMQSLTERAALRDVNGRAVHFGFRDYLGVGLLGFGVILSVAIVRTLWAIA